MSTNLLAELAELYACPVTGARLDPLKVRLELIRATAGRLWSLLDDRSKSAERILNPSSDADLATAELLQLRALDGLIPAAVKVFVRPDNPLTASEALAAIDAYIDWADQKKTRQSTLQISPELLASLLSQSTPASSSE